MTTPFANIQARINQQTVARLANANVLYEGATFTAIFDNESIEDINVTINQPIITCLASDVDLVKRGKTIEVNDVLYTVQDIRPDGSGMTVLGLRLQ
jgi:hypothetical protein